jgi:acetamidase/formamidase
MTRMLPLLLLFSALFACAQTQGTGARPDELSGEWILTERVSDETQTRRMSLQQNRSGSITGRSGASTVAGTLNGPDITLRWLTGSGRLLSTYTGKLLNGTLSGDADVSGLKVQWSARRPAARPSGGPRTHRFTPREFHRTYSAAHSPVLRIFPGDTVQTTSIDAAGTDERSVRRVLGGDPLTGPFYVEGALPGDTLVVTFNRIRPNRDWAWSGQSLVGNALAPDYLLNTERDREFNSRWKIDRDKRVVYLEAPTAALKRFTVPLQPMVGSVGVAPPGRNAIRTIDSGTFGGNMDYNQLREGATLYLPVFHEGALLLIGDGHAVQGDGELTGDALETSMDLEFTVDVIREQSLRTPRAENAEYLMAIGIGGSLDQALQIATTDMARWLESAYKLTSNESAMVLGSAAKYDVADLVSTQVSIVAKIPKSVLASFPGPARTP